MKRKLLSILLVLVMFASMSFTTMATGTNEQNDTADITITLSYGDANDGSNNFFTTTAGEAIAMKELSVPYFDLALYGLENYYYDENCYMNGQQPGTPETAKGHVTMLHALIYATEVFHCGLSISDAGQGYLYDNDYLEEDFMWQDQIAGSFFLLQFWDIATGGSLMYHINHEYPIGIEGTEWGSTMDQIELVDGDHVSFHVMGFYDGSSVCATSYGRFTANGETESTAVTKGDQVELNLTYIGSESLWMPISSRNEERFEGLEVYYTDSRLKPFEEWTLLGTTDAEGNITVDTSDLSAGSYCFATVPLHDEIYYESSSNCFEYAPAAFVINVVDPNAPEEPQVLYGDVNGDGKITPYDATLVLRHDAEIESLGDTGLVAADVNGDGKVTPFDATLILRFDAELINKFPVENND